MLNVDVTCPSKTSIRKVLEEKVEDIEKHILDDLPPGARISLALDCWTSPNKHAFLAITGYFIDAGWRYREVLLGFEGLEGKHSGLNLCTVLRVVLDKYGIADRILAITTDNASNNGTLTKELQQALSMVNFNARGGHISCLAHVLQLSLKELLGKIRIEPKNDDVDTTWREEDLNELDEAEGISKTLGKVR
jgi:hypothetical protein